MKVSGLSPSRSSLCIGPRIRVLRGKTPRKKWSGRNIAAQNVQAPPRRDPRHSKDENHLDPSRTAGQQSRHRQKCRERGQEKPSLRIEESLHEPHEDHGDENVNRQPDILLANRRDEAKEEVQAP